MVPRKIAIEAMAMKSHDGDVIRAMRNPLSR
jgi:hypothetical protein